ncbi:MAG: helix-turn-helix domain-containing protein [Deltaproteobacteria bacterium]|nr:helix-turn-helix domain-containing protein [Deltaproteobacteria bacterium]
MIEELYTSKEAAKLLGIQIKTLYNLISARELSAKRGRPLLIPEPAIKDYIKKKTTKSVR